MNSARVEAARFTAEMLKDRAQNFWGTQPWTITCTDRKGLIFFSIEVHGMSAAAGGGPNT